MKEVKLKNYSTRIKAEKTITEIEKMLLMFGAEAIMKEYSEDGRVRSLAFKLTGKAYKLPANIGGVREVMFRDKRESSRVNGEQKRDEQAYNTTWRIMKDWVYSQLSIVVSGQAMPDEIMLPFMFDGEKTLYQSYKEGRLRIEDKIGK